MRELYLFPMRNETDLESKSPYVFHLAKQLEVFFDVVNYGKVSRYGIINILQYLFRAKYFYFNWIENMSTPQIPLFFLFLFFSKLLRKKIVWTHHNRHPHKADSKIAAYVMEVLQRHASYIIIHTKESYEILDKVKDKRKILYFFHPFFKDNIEPDNNNVKQIDILIWGNIRKSKGTESFLKFMKDSNNLALYKIKIAGKFPDESYYKSFVDEYAGPSLSIENKFLTSEELASLHKDSRYIFFPYTGSSVLNSGALITSVPFGASIIGPNTGGFKELGELGYIDTYNTFSDVIRYLENDEPLTRGEREALRIFVKGHSWPKFGEFLSSHLR